MMQAIAQSIFTAITGDAALMALVVGVYEDRAQAADPGANAGYPYIILGDNIAGPWSNDDWSGGDVLIRINAFSRYAGTKEVCEISDRVRAVLDRANLTVAGYSAVTMNFDGFSIEDDPDGETKQGVTTMRLLIN